MEKNTKQIAGGAILSYVNVALGAIITLLYTPFMIRILGQSEYGLYNTVSSVIASLSLLSLGFGSCYVKFYSRYKACDDKKQIESLNGMFMIIFIFIGIISFVVGTLLSANLDLIFGNGLTEFELKKARVLMIILTINLSLSFPASVFTSIITASERFIFQKIVMLLKQSISPLICIPILLMGYASIGIVCGTVFIYIVLDIINWYYCVSKLGARFNFRHFHWNLLKEMAVYSGFIAINMLVDQVNLNIDKFLLGRFCGTGAVAVYSAGFTLYMYFSSFSTSISNVFIPRIHKIWSNNHLSCDEKDTVLSDLFSLVGRIQFSILMLVVTGIVLFGKQFIRIWAGDGYENAYYVLLLLATSAVVPLSQNLGIEIQRAKNKHQFRAILYLAMAMINLLLSVYLCQIYGEIGSALGTAVSFLIANTICMNWFYKKVIHIDISKYWKNSTRIMIFSIPPLILGMLFCKMVNTYNIVWLFCGICVYTAIYCVFIFLSCDEHQRRNITGLIKGAGRRVNRMLHLKKEEIK